MVVTEMYVPSLLGNLMSVLEINSPGVSLAILDLCHMLTTILWLSLIHVSYNSSLYGMCNELRFKRSVHTVTAGERAEIFKKKKHLTLKIFDIIVRDLKCASLHLCRHLSYSLYSKKKTVAVVHIWSFSSDGF